MLYASIAALLAMVVHADGKFDRLERIEVDWIMNFAVPAQFGDSFRFSPAAEAAYQALGDAASGLDEARRSIVSARRGARARERGLAGPGRGA